jgi:hypothetical protein
VSAPAKPYAGDFIGRWLDRLIYCDAPAWMFTIAYLAFGALVLATLLLIPPRMPGFLWRAESGGQVSPPR